MDPCPTAPAPNDLRILLLVTGERDLDLVQAMVALIGLTSPLCGSLTQRDRVTQIGSGSRLGVSLRPVVVKHSWGSTAGDYGDGGGRCRWCLVCLLSGTLHSHSWPMLSARHMHCDSYPCCRLWSCFSCLQTYRSLPDLTRVVLRLCELDVVTGTTCAFCRASPELHLQGRLLYEQQSSKLGLTFALSRVLLSISLSNWP